MVQAAEALEGPQGIQVPSLVAREPPRGNLQLVSTLLEFYRTALTPRTHPGFELVVGVANSCSWLSRDRVSPRSVSIALIYPNVHIAHQPMRGMQ